MPSHSLLRGRDGRPKITIKYRRQRQKGINNIGMRNGSAGSVYLSAVTPRSVVGYYCTAVQNRKPTRCSRKKRAFGPSLRTLRTNLPLSVASCSNLVSFSPFSQETQPLVLLHKPIFSSVPGATLHLHMSVSHLSGIRGATPPPAGLPLGGRRPRHQAIAPVVALVGRPLGC